jgi:hypothetical protein
MFIALLD